MVVKLNHLKEKIEEYEQYIKDEGQREDDSKLNERIDAGSELDIDFVEEG